MTNSSPDRHQGKVGSGIFTGFLISVFLYLPLTVLGQKSFGVPKPDPIPPLALWDGLHQLAASFWFSWLGGLVVCLIPAVVCIGFSRSRGFGTGYLIACTPMCILIAAAMSSYYIGG